MALVQHLGQVKLYTSALLHTILNDITIVSYSDEYDEKADKKVPIFMVSTDNRSTAILNEEIAQSLPAMTLAITGLERNIERQRNKLLRRKAIRIDDLYSTVFTYNDIPHDIRYELNIIAPSQTVLFDIVEHILSFFHDGKYYVNIRLPLYPNNYYSCPVILEGQDVIIQQAGDDYFSQGSIQATLNFVVKGVFHSFADIISFQRVLKKNEKEGKKLTNEDNPLNNLTKHDIRKIILDFVNCVDLDDASKKERHEIEVDK